MFGSETFTGQGFLRLRPTTAAESRKPVTPSVPPSPHSSVPATPLKNSLSLSPGSVVLELESNYKLVHEPRFMKVFQDF